VAQPRHQLIPARSCCFAHTTRSENRSCGNGGPEKAERRERVNRNPISQSSDLRSQVADLTRKKKNSASESIKLSGPNANSGPNTKKKNTPEDDAAEAEEVEVMLTLAPTARIDSLKIS